MLLNLNLPINKHLLVFIMEAAQKLTDGWMDKGNVVYTYNTKFLSL